MDNLINEIEKVVNFTEQKNANGIKIDDVVKIFAENDNLSALYYIYCFGFYDGFNQLKNGSSENA